MRRQAIHFKRSCKLNPYSEISSKGFLFVEFRAIGGLAVFRVETRLNIVYCRFSSAINCFSSIGRVKQ